MAVSFGDIQGSAGGVQSNERRPVGATVRCVAPKYAVSPPVLRPDESFGWGCLRGLHSDRGSPNLTLRLALEAKLSRRLVQTWDLRHRGFLLQKAVSASWAPAARVAAGAEEEGMERAGRSDKGEFRDPAFRLVVKVAHFLSAHRKSFDAFLRASYGPTVRFSFPERPTFNRFSSILSGAHALISPVDTSSGGVAAFRLVLDFAQPQSRFIRDSPASPAHSNRRDPSSRA